MSKPDNRDLTMGGKETPTDTLYHHVKARPVFSCICIKD